MPRKKSHRSTPPHLLVMTKITVMKSLSSSILKGMWKNWSSAVVRWVSKEATSSLDYPVGLFPNTLHEHSSPPNILSTSAAAQ